MKGCSCYTLEISFIFFCLIVIKLRRLLQPAHQYHNTNVPFLLPVLVENLQPVNYTEEKPGCKAQDAGHVSITELKSCVNVPELSISL